MKKFLLLFPMLVIGAGFPLQFASGPLPSASSAAAYVSSSATATTIVGLTMTLSSIDAGSAGVVVVIISWHSGTPEATISSVTHGASSLTRLGGTTGNEFAQGLDVWYGTGLNGSATVTANVSGSASYGSMVAMVFSGATTVDGLVMANNGSRSTYSTSVSSTTSSIVGQCMAIYASDPTYTSDGGQTDRAFHDSVADINTYSSTKPGASSVTVGWGLSGASTTVCASFSVNP